MPYYLGRHSDDYLGLDIDAPLFEDEGDDEDDEIYNIKKRIKTKNGKNKE